METDGTLSIVDSKPEELESIYSMERDAETQQYIIPYSLARHQAEFNKAEVIYKSIYDNMGCLIGFLILVLDPDGKSMEFRRIVIRERGKGYGRRRRDDIYSVVEELWKDYQLPPVATTRPALQIVSTQSAPADAANDDKFESAA